MMQFSAGTQTLLSACIAISLLELGSCVQFYVRRHYTPIRERTPVVSIICHIAIVLHLSLTLLILIIPVQCFLVFVVLNYAGAIANNTVFLRYLNFYLQYRLNRSKIFASCSMPVLANISHMVPISSVTYIDRWLLNNKWVLTWRLHAPFLVVVVVLITSFNIYSATLPSVHECANPDEVNIMMQIWYLCLTLMLGYLTFLMRIVPDAYHIKWELFIHFRLALLAIGLWLIPFLNDFNKNRFPILALSYFAMVQIRWVVSVVLPIQWSYKTYRMNGMTMMSVQEIMQRPDALDAFHQFLINESCIENLYFLLAVQQLERLKRSATARASVVLTQGAGRGKLSLANFRHDLFVDDGVIVNTINDIYHTFCVPSSAFAINISSQQLQTIQQNLAASDPNVFQGAANEIEKLLEHNSLPRFLTSDLGRQWCFSP